MMTWSKYASVLLVLSILLGAGVSPAAAKPGTTTSKDGGGSPVIDIDIPLKDVVDAVRDLIDKLTDFTGGFQDLLTDVLVTVLFKPFQYIAEVLVNVLTHVITSYPNVKSSDVLQLHALIFKLSLIIASVGFVGIGFLHITGRVHGVRPTASLTAALGFGGVAPWILWYPVEISRLATLALKPANPGFWAVTRVTVETGVITALNAFLLLAVVAVFVLRDVYLMFAVATAPLLAVGAVFPYTRRFAQPLIGLFWAFLLVGPLDMIVFRLTLSLLETQGGGIPHWIWAFGGLIMMVGVPYVVLSSGMSLVGTALSFLGGVNIRGTKNWKMNRGDSPPKEAPGQRQQGNSGTNRFTREGSRQW